MKKKTKRKNVRMNNKKIDRETSKSNINNREEKNKEKKEKNINKIGFQVATSATPQKKP